MLKNTIFIQIASYRDSELIPTIEDCLKKAQNPEALSFAIVNQYDANDEFSSTLDQYQNDPRFSILNVPARESLGVCWARHQTNKMYRGQYFILQIDSHSRFIQNWDTKIIESWLKLEDDKAIYTAYPPRYQPSQQPQEWDQIPYIIHVYNISKGRTQQRPKRMNNWENRSSPVLARHVAAGFMFGRGTILQDVPYDPDFYFSEEEPALTVKLYTHGYNLYHPNEFFLWHYYTRKESPKHWSDQNTREMSSRSSARLKSLLGLNNDYIDFKDKGLGEERSLEDYKNYAGIDFSNSILHIDTREAKDLPVNLSDLEGWTYKIKNFNKTLSWDFSAVDKCEDPRFWAFIFKDKYDEELYRLDVKYSKDKDIIDGKITKKHFSFTHYEGHDPAYFIIWPYSQSKKWLSSTKVLM
jgi:hypothetical protein